MMTDPRIEVLGAAWLEETPHGLLPHRLPAWTRAQYESELYGLNVTQGSGVRLRFATASDRLALRVRASRQLFEPVPPAPALPARDCGPFDVVIDGEVVATSVPTGGRIGLLRADGATATVDDDPGDELTVTFTLPPAPPGEGRRTVEIWLPYRDRVRLLALEADDLEAAEPSGHPRWVHYGSSISHGAEAASPARTWVGVAARRAGLDVHNLGFGGAALMDPFVARTIRDLDVDVISVKVGINVLNADAYGRRVFGPLLHGFLDTIREGHPDTPLLVVSPIFCPIGEDLPGPTMIDPARLPEVRFRSLGSPGRIAEGALTLRAMRGLIAGIVADRRAAGDRELHHLDGLDLYGEADDAATPMADLLHPDPPAHELIGRRAAAVLADLVRGRARAGSTAAARTPAGRR